MEITYLLTIGALMTLVTTMPAKDDLAAREVEPTADCGDCKPSVMSCQLWCYETMEVVDQLTYCHIYCNSLVCAECSVSLSYSGTFTRCVE